jgi:hypothetical protein
MNASVQASLISNAGSSASRAKEIGDAAQEVHSKSTFDNNQTSATDGSSNQQSSQAYTGSEESKQQSEQYLSSLQGVEQASKKYSETASMQDSAAKSVSMSYQDLGTRLENAGMGPAINKANDAIESGMSSVEKGKRSSDAQYDINNSSASGMVGGSREALAGFLKLEKSDPVAAAGIMNEMVNPGGQGSGVGISPSEFKGGSKSQGDILDSQTAAGFKSKATGASPDDGDDAGDSTPLSNGGGKSLGQASVAGKSGSAGTKTTGTQAVSPSSHKPSPGVKTSSQQLGGSTTAAVNEALKGTSLGSPNEVAAKIEKGGHVSSESMTGKAGRAFVLEGQNANENIVKPLTQSAGNFVSDGRQIMSGVANDAKQMMNSALDAGKKFDQSIGIDSSPSLGNPTNNISLDDLPPIKK